MQRLQYTNLVPRPPSQTLSHSRGEKSGGPPTFLHGCEIKSVYEVNSTHTTKQAKKGQYWIMFHIPLP